MAGFLREVIVYSAYNVIQRYNAYSSNNMDKLPVIKDHNLFHARNLCNSEVFHVFLGKDVVYALRYPYYQRLSCEAKMTSLTNGSGGESSFTTFRPRFYWPHGPKIYASDTQILPNWIFEEYMQEGYFWKIMDINDFDIRDSIIAMIRKDKGDSALFDFICREVGDESLGAHYYLWFIDYKVKRGTVFLNVIVKLMWDKRLKDFIESGLGKEEVVEYYMRLYNIEKVWELLT